MAGTNTDQEKPWFLKSTFPVLFPTHPALSLSDENFNAFITNELASYAAAKQEQDAGQANDLKTEDDRSEADTETFTMIDASASTTADAREAMAAVDLDASPTPSPAAAEPFNPNPFMRGLLSHLSEPEEPPSLENKMLTENGDIAHRSTTNPLVDLFYELEEVVSPPRLIELLNAAWSHDADKTLKIIFNARSIHLGKSSKSVFYRCAGWLAQNHPLTLVTNLRWLSRPVIEKKVEKKKEGVTDETPVLIDAADVDENDPAHHDVRNGVAHGYWKDLLNILALAANGKLRPLENPKDVLNVDERGAKGVRAMQPDEAKVKRRGRREDRNKAAAERFEQDPVYRALHLTVARLFAEQLGRDLALLRDGGGGKKKISLCAKWAPTPARFHDEHTCVVSTIAELCSPPAAPASDGDAMAVDEDRETYLRRARESYRRDVAALRKQLEVVERDLAAKTLGNIKYERVPSVAMRNYTKIFAEKDTDRFDEYITKVAQGQARISGAVLMPSTMISDVRQAIRGGTYGGFGGGGGGKQNQKALVAAKVAQMRAKVSDGQWATLVQRIRDSGTLSSSIAVCDVSGSMQSPQFADGTTPMDSAIGLSLLVAEVTAPPFGGAFITFSQSPAVERVDLAATLEQKVRNMEQSDWGGCTNFTAVFEKLILPLAVENKIKPEDMVKRVFVFSDMQFNTADDHRYAWSTSFERISKMYDKAGYEMPELVFWNLAGGRAGVTGWGDPTAPKPVMANEKGTALVSGYSQGMLKVFLEGGGFEDPDEEEGVKEAKATESDSDAGSAQETKRQKKDPLDMVKKAIGHKAYSMLQVVD